MRGRFAARLDGGHAGIELLQGFEHETLQRQVEEQQDAEQRLEQLVERWAYLTELAEASGVF